MSWWAAWWELPQVCKQPKCSEVFESTTAVISRSSQSLQLPPCIDILQACAGQRVSLIKSMLEPSGFWDDHGMHQVFLSWGKVDLRAKLCCSLFHWLLLVTYAGSFSNTLRSSRLGENRVPFGVQLWWNQVADPPQVAASKWWSSRASWDVELRQFEYRHRTFQRTNG